MIRGVLLDTGPLVAALNRHDTWHEWAKAQWMRIEPPMYTCEAVLTEACFLMQNHAQCGHAILELVKRKIIVPVFHADQHHIEILRLMKKYSDQPMSFADACLVRMSEVYPESNVFTLDNHFHVYRRQGRRRIPLIIPASDSSCSGKQ